MYALCRMLSFSLLQTGRAKLIERRNILSARISLEYAFDVHVVHLLRVCLRAGEQDEYVTTGQSPNGQIFNW